MAFEPGLESALCILLWSPDRIQGRGVEDGVGIGATVGLGVGVRVGGGSVVGFDANIGTRVAGIEVGRGF